MQNPLFLTLQFMSFFLSFSLASDLEFQYPHCHCELGDHSIFKWQKASDFLIAVSYFSIPLELLYFVSRSPYKFPFKWLLFQFGSFIVLCGLTHFLTTFTYYGPHSFLLSVTLTIVKFLTALVSFLTAITLLTLIPQLLRIKVRENLLWLKADELRREVKLMKSKEEAQKHVRMLTHEIRKYLDRHAILYTTLVELSKALNLQNCAVWMPDDMAQCMILTHELNPSQGSLGKLSIPMDDEDVVGIKTTEGVQLVRPESFIGSSSAGDAGQFGSVAAIRMQMLKVSDFKGGTPELIHASYAILVLVSSNENSKIWGPHDLETIEVVADQVAVALSHAVVLEESQVMREKLAEQNRALLKAKRDAIMANEARTAFQSILNQELKRPIYSILNLLEMVRVKNLNFEQRLIIDAIYRTGNLVSVLIDDLMDACNANKLENFCLEVKPFELKPLIKEAISVVKCLCEIKGFHFEMKVGNYEIPNFVLGDEKRVFHVILHMVGSILRWYNKGGCVIFRVLSEEEREMRSGQRWDQRWNLGCSSGYTCVKFEIALNQTENSDFNSGFACDGLDMDQSFSMCKQLVKMMQGSIYASLNPQRAPQSISLLLRFKIQPQMDISNSDEFKRGLF
ncbi:hypothetical protein LUZ60_006907 [Juncus effusus]|nr:hypothetical protein LUZ60_006907 [Juncus effusus]